MTDFKLFGLFFVSVKIIVIFGTMADKKRIFFIDHAWSIAGDSMSYPVFSNAGHDEDTIAKARNLISNMDKADWLPFAEYLYDKGELFNEKSLAERAAEEFINTKLNTTGLKVRFSNS